MTWQPESCPEIVGDLRLRTSFLLSPLLANINLSSKIQKLVNYAEIATGLSESLMQKAELKISNVFFWKRIKLSQASTKPERISLPKLLP